MKYECQFQFINVRPVPLPHPPHIPRYANFVLVKVGDGNAVFKAMMDQGVIVRAMAAYKLPEWVRISIGTMP